MKRAPRSDYTEFQSCDGAFGEFRLRPRGHANAFASEFVYAANLCEMPTAIAWCLMDIFSDRRDEGAVFTSVSTFGNDGGVITIMIGIANVPCLDC